MPETDYSLKIEPWESSDGDSHYYSRGHHDAGAFLQAAATFARDVEGVDPPDAGEPVRRGWWRTRPLLPGDPPCLDWEWVIVPADPGDEGAFPVTYCGPELDRRAE